MTRREELVIRRGESWKKEKPNIEEERDSEDEERWRRDEAESDGDGDGVMAIRWPEAGNTDNGDTVISKLLYGKLRT